MPLPSPLPRRLQKGRATRNDGNNDDDNSDDDNNDDDNNDDNNNDDDNNDDSRPQNENEAPPKDQQRRRRQSPPPTAAKTKGKEENKQGQQKRKCCVDVRCSRLRGLDAFPNVQTLVLDSNGLLSLPMDCPWCPAMETLWLCNNEVENLDGLLCQVGTDTAARALGAFSPFSAHEEKREGDLWGREVGGWGGWCDVLSWQITWRQERRLGAGFREREGRYEVLLLCFVLFLYLRPQRGRRKFVSLLEAFALKDIVVKRMKDTYSSTVGVLGAARRRDEGRGTWSLGARGWKSFV